VLLKLCQKQKGETMKRDLELLRKILFVIEEQYKAGEVTIWGPKIDGYDMVTVAEHCDLLYQQGLIKQYLTTQGGGSIQAFRVGNLTAQGYDYLELIRNGDVWDKTTEEIETKKLPKTLETIAQVAGIFSGSFFKELNNQ
jgi:uncharacterized protein DUF2513